MNLTAEGQQRKRQQRKVEEMKEYADTLLGIGVSLVKKVSQKLSQQ